MEIIFRKENELHGYGYGSDDGYGYGYGEYHRKGISAWASKWPAPQQSRLAELQQQGATIAYWKSKKDATPANGGRANPVAAGTIQEDTGPLSLCHKGTLHATLVPEKWQGERKWIVALIGEVVGDDDKLGALKREIIGECVE